MAFKQKPCKIKFTQELKTLDEIYTETIQKFDNVNDDILSIKKKILRLKNKIKDTQDINKLNEINNNIIKLENQIATLENSNDELEYFEKTKDILIKYFENTYSYDNFWFNTLLSIILAPIYIGYFFIKKIMNNII